MASIAVGKGRQRGANGISDAFLQEHRKGRCCRDDPLGAQTRLRESQMQGVVALRSQHTVDIDQVLDTAHLGAEDNTVAWKTVPFGSLG